MVGAVGQRGDPLTAPLCFLLPFSAEKSIWGWYLSQSEAAVHLASHRIKTDVKWFLKAVKLPEVSRGLSADGHRFVFLIITLEDLFTFWRLQQSNTGGYRWTVSRETNTDAGQSSVLTINLLIVRIFGDICSVSRSHFVGFDSTVPFWRWSRDAALQALISGHAYPIMQCGRRRILFIQDGGTWADSGWSGTFNCTVKSTTIHSNIYQKKMFQYITSHLSL